jgi:hypothetical protein
MVELFGLLGKNNQTYQGYSQTGTTCPTAPVVERIITHNSVDVYDGAIWEIALRLAASENNPAIPKSDAANFKAAVSEYEQLLVNDNPQYLITYRAFQYTNNDRTQPLTLTPNQFQYGQPDNLSPPPNVAMPNAYRAYIRRFLAPSYANNADPDPVTKSAIHLT